MTLPTDTERERPVEPEFRAAQRLRYVLRWFESGDWQDHDGHGWGRLDGPWLHVNDDDFGHWQTWPASAVTVVEWEVP